MAVSSTARPAADKGLAPGRGKINEDWLATIIGLVVVLILGSGLLGAGGQTVTLSAEAGEVASATPRGLSGWQVSATLDGEKIAVDDAPTRLQAGDAVALTCADGALSSAPAETQGTEVDPGRALLLLDNRCDGELVVTYRLAPIVPWPIFNLFSR